MLTLCGIDVVLIIVVVLDIGIDRENGCLWETL